MQKIEISNQELKLLEPIFVAWQRIIRDSSKHAGGVDSPYVHNEQGNNHLFASACGHANYTAMQEVVGKSKTTQSARRLDVCFFDEEATYVAEAKWVEFDGGKLPLEIITQRFKAASDDVSNYEGQSPIFDRLGARLAILYVVPHFSSRVSDSELELIVTTIVENTGAEAYAYSFLQSDRGLEYHVKGRLYPGVLALIKKVR